VAAKGRGDGGRLCQGEVAVEGYGDRVALKSRAEPSESDRDGMGRTARPPPCPKLALRGASSHISGEGGSLMLFRFAFWAGAAFTYVSLEMAGG